MRYDTYDIVILGCGPAGLSAAINATIRNKKVLVVGAEICSPPLHKAQKIDNYLGFPNIRGEELLEKFMHHAEEMNIEIVHTKASMINEIGGQYSILIGDEVVTGKAIIIATGIPYKATLPREEEFLGKGLGYCATCDGPLYRDKDVVIIGYNKEAEIEANFMAEICRKVYYIPMYKEKIQLDSRIEIIMTRAQEIVGEEIVTGLKLRNNQTLSTDGIFVIGTETSPERLLPGLEMDGKHIKVNRQQETNLPGVYAAGDCAGQPYQVAKSIGEGQIAGLAASKYVSQK